ncbi:MAG TPA: PASTA domain-containing protein [Vicingaceae bacterium]|nr:PASTA domain-containing protein [Vicingaceae bacterium]
MIKFFFSKLFLVNLLAAIVLFIIAFFSFSSYLTSYTMHGESVTVPSLEGLSEEEVAALLTEKNLRYEILDSIYVDKKPKGVVIDQNPKPESFVKKNRKIYITTTKILTPKVTFPSVRDMSQRLAVAKLESYGLKVNIEYRPSEHEGIVVDCKYKNNSVNAGDLIDMNAKVTVIIGTGKGEGKVLVPYLVNLTQAAAYQKLQDAFLSIGLEIYDESCTTEQDSLNAKVYKQSPVFSSESALHVGSSVDIYLTCDTTKIKVENISLDSLNVHPGNNEETE